MRKLVEAAIGPETAGILIEPVQGEGGVRVVPNEFLQGLRELCDKHGLLLFFDTLFFGVFFADLGACEAQLTAADCLAATNEATGAALCSWSGYAGGYVEYAEGVYTARGTCALTPPPGSLTFALLLAAE